jgi:hypothetical protein
MESEKMTSINPNSSGSYLAAFKSAVRDANNAVSNTPAQPQGKRGPIDHGKTTAQAYVKAADFTIQQSMTRLNQLNSNNPKFVSDIRQPSNFQAMLLIIPETVGDQMPLELDTRKQMFASPIRST